MKSYNELTREQKELYLFITNTAGYLSVLDMVEKNLMRHKIRGIYSPAKAPQAFAGVVARAANRYNRDFGTPGTHYSTLFPRADRVAVCEALCSEFEGEFSCGNVDFSTWTLAAIRKNPEFIRHSPYFFSKDTLKFWGNRLSESEITAPHKIEDFFGKTSVCFCIKMVAHDDVFGASDHYYYFDINTFERVFPKEK